MKKTLPFLYLLIFFCSCTDETDPGLGFLDYMVFGTFYGECSGDCIRLYRVSANALEEGTNTGFLGENHQFLPGRVLDGDAFARARTLLQNIPAELINNPKERYGCPDCRDQGGLYLNYRINGKLTTVTIDPDDTSDQAEAIIRFKDELFDLVWELRN